MFLVPPRDLPMQLYGDTTTGPMILESTSRNALKARNPFAHAEVRERRAAELPKKQNAALGFRKIKPALGKIEDKGKRYFDLRFFQFAAHPRGGRSKAAMPRKSTN